MDEIKILVIEDDADIREGIRILLESEGFHVDEAENGETGLQKLSADVGLVILDIMMPKVNGLDVLKQIRESGSGVPVLMLTAKTEIEDRVAGLEAGADDYLPKPFASPEFIARVKALSRRNAGYAQQRLSFENVQLDCNRYELTCESRAVRLNNKEFQLMELFMRNPRFVFSTAHLMDKIWGQDSEADISVVWTYVGFLRKKLKELDADIEIRTARGAGYFLDSRE